MQNDIKVLRKISLNLFILIIYALSVTFFLLSEANKAIAEMQSLHMQPVFTERQ